LAEEGTEKYNFSGRVAEIQCKGIGTRNTRDQESHKLRKQHATEDDKMNGRKSTSRPTCLEKSVGLKKLSKDRRGGQTKVKRGNVSVKSKKGLFVG